MGEQEVLKNASARAVFTVSELVLIIFVGLATAACSPVRTASTMEFFVDQSDAVFGSCDSVSFRELAVACHRLRAGESTVIGVREYSEKGVDQERFRKITFVLDHGVKAGDSLDLSAHGTKAFYSTGLSYMPGNAGCYGTAKSGTITVLETTASAMVLDVEAIFDLKSPTPSDGAR